MLTFETGVAQHFLVKKVIIDASPVLQILGARNAYMNYQCAVRKVHGKSIYLYILVSVPCVHYAHCHGRVVLWE